MVRVLKGGGTLKKIGPKGGGTLKILRPKGGVDLKFFEKYVLVSVNNNLLSINFFGNM